MPSNVLASPSFLAGPQDQLATVDVYTGTAAGIVNAIQSLEAKYNVDLIGMLRAGAAAAQILPVVQGIANGQLLMNPQAAIARLLTASNTLVAAVNGTPLTSAFNSLSSGVQSAIGAAGQVVGQVEATIGGVVSTIANGAIGDIRSLGQLINGFANDAGAFLMVDTQALGGMAAGIINQCAKLGVAGAFGQMVSNITHPAVLNSIVRQTLPDLLRTGDLVSLQALATVAGGAGMAANHPSVIAAFTSTYNRRASGNQTQAAPAQDAATFSQMLTVFNRVKPDWDHYARASPGAADDAIDILPLLGGTGDFRSALASGIAASADPGQQLYGLAAVYPVTDVDTQLKAMYPDTYIDPALRSTSVPVEPAQANSAQGVNAATSTTAIPNRATPAATSVPPPNDRVGSQPNAVTFEVNPGDTGTDQQNMAILWS